MIQVALSPPVAFGLAFLTTELQTFQTGGGVHGGAQWVHADLSPARKARTLCSFHLVIVDYLIGSRGYRSACRNSRLPYS